MKDWRLEHCPCLRRDSGVIMSMTIRQSKEQDEEEEEEVEVDDDLIEKLPGCDNHLLAKLVANRWAIRAGEILH